MHGFMYCNLPLDTYMVSNIRVQGMKHFDQGNILKQRSIIQLHYQLMFNADLSRPFVYVIVLQHTKLWVRLLMP